VAGIQSLSLVERESVPMRSERINSLAEKVLEEIRGLIVAGGMALGQRVSEVELAGRLGVSRTPVREALQRLVTEGLVIVEPQRGTFVFEPELREIEEIVQLRALLEVGALRLLSSTQVAQLVAKWEEIVDRARDALAAGQIDRFPGLDQEFHMAIFQCLGNRPLLDYYRIATGRVQALRVRHVCTLDRATRSQQSHLKMVDTLRSGNPKSCETMLESHVAQSLASFRASPDVRFKG
jgi:DNA-binding GntR family transcriptional regulator